MDNHKPTENPAIKPHDAPYLFANGNNEASRKTPIMGALNAPLLKKQKNQKYFK